MCVDMNVKHLYRTINVMSGGNNSLSLKQQINARLDQLSVIYEHAVSAGLPLSTVDTKRLIELEDILDALIDRLSDRTRLTDIPISGTPLLPLQATDAYIRRFLKSLQTICD